MFLKGFSKQSVAAAFEEALTPTPTELYKGKKEKLRERLKNGESILSDRTMPYDEAVVTPIFVEPLRCGNLIWTPNALWWSDHFFASGVQFGWDKSLALGKLVSLSNHQRPVHYVMFREPGKWVEIKEIKDVSKLGFPIAVASGPRWSSTRLTMIHRKTLEPLLSEITQDVCPSIHMAAFCVGAMGLACNATPRDQAACHIPQLLP